MRRERTTPTVPTRIPGSESHAASVLSEAEQAFRQDRTKDGIANLAHAVYIQATKGGLTSDEAKVWFNRIERAAGVWETDA